MAEVPEQSGACSLLRAGASRLPDGGWLRAAYLIMVESSVSFRPKNVFDREFRVLPEHVWSSSGPELKALMKKREGAREPYGELVDGFRCGDIWKIPLMIGGMYREYQPYLRHCGGCLVPTESVQLCRF